MSKQLLFSVTANDCDWQFVRGSGKGGQKRNKTSNAVRCVHRASGATGFSEAGRSQLHNRQEAFKKMSQTPEFKKWHSYEVARKTGDMRKIEEKVAYEMAHNVLVEVKDEKGSWVQATTTERVSG